MNKEMLLTAEKLRTLVEYDRETGVFQRISGPYSGRIVGAVRPDGRIFVALVNKLYYAHRLAWLYCFGQWPDGAIDHINGDPSDNRIANLRVATASENLQNQKLLRRHSKSGLIGAHWHALSGKYRSSIMLRGKARYLGLFDTADEAHAVYLAAKQFIHTGTPPERMVGVTQ